MRRFFRYGLTLGLSAALPVSLAGCAPDYSPNTYASTAVQQANKVEQGVVVGVRKVDVSAQGTTGALAGGAAGGIVGSQVPGGGVSTAFGALGGTVIGGIVGTTVEHTTGDTTAYEYIVRKSNGDLLSVTQRDETPLVLRQRVLLIAGSQARIVPDYTTADDPKPVVPDPLPQGPVPVSPPSPPGPVAGSSVPAVSSQPLPAPATAASTPAITAPPAATSPTATPPAATSSAAPTAAASPGVSLPAFPPPPPAATTAPRP